VFGFVAAVLTISSHPSHAAPYSDIVVDANTGNVLHSTNPDARRHPASLTKIMTLYLLFEQLEAGKLKLDSQLKVSKEAADQDPTKLELKAGSTIQVEDAIKGIVTRSANDAAVVVAEAIAGDEDQFAKLMTRKARALGMSNTVYKNASGLPDDGQITTARDQSTLGRAIQERFPKYYKYFSIRSFTFRGESIANHNRLLGNVEGVDGIKTGYVNASGFNLVTSVHRGNRYLVAVIMGGSSAGSRDARMRELISDKIAQASTKRTASMVAEADIPEAKSEPKAVAKVEPKPEAKPEAKAERRVAAIIIDPKAEPKAESKPEARFAVASAASVPARLNSSGSSASNSSASGSTDPIRPVLVRTVTVRAGNQGASSPPLQVLSVPVAEPDAKPEIKPETKSVQAAPPAAPPAPPAQSKVEPKIEPKAEAKPEPKAEPKPEPAAESKTERFALASASSTFARFTPMTPKAEPAAPKAEAVTAKAEPAQPEPALTAALPPPPPGARPGVLGVIPARPATFEPATPAAVSAAKPPLRSGWMIQVGAYQAEQEAKQRLTTVQSKASKVLGGADPFTETVDKGGTTYYRARFAGLDKDKAEAACKYLKRNDVECVTIKN
jgi:D-alanyl-D-alanine carboxypeptidase